MKFGRFWENLGDSKWLKEASGSSDEKARASKYDWTGALDNPECPGNVLTLNPGEATRISSHKNYGEKTYPDNYRVREIGFFNQVIHMVVYICVSFWLLAHESRDLSQAETKINVVTS